MTDTKPDDHSEAPPDGAGEPKPEKRTVILGNGDQHVTVEGPDDLQQIAQVAAYFWLMVSPPDRVRVGFTAGSSLVTERSGPYEEQRGADEMG